MTTIPLVLRGDLLPDVFQVRASNRPARRTCSGRVPAGEVHRGRPEGVVRSGDEYFVSVVQKALHGHDDEPLTRYPYRCLDFHPLDPDFLQCCMIALRAEKRPLESLYPSRP